MRQWWSTRRPPSWYVASLAVILGIGIALRLRQLSSGTLFRDDAWVALTSRVDLATAWKMVGASPGFILGMRSWTQVTQPTTWLMQLPTLIVSIGGLLTFVAVARWWGLSRVSTLITTAILAGSRIGIEYSTHLKPYSHDILMASVLLVAAAVANRPKGIWLFGIAGAVSVVTSLTALPLVVGLAAVVILRAQRRGALRSVFVPAVVMGLPLIAMCWAVARTISPRLHDSWQPNFIDYTNRHTVIHSSTSMLRGLLWGLFDTTPAVHLNGAGLAITAVIVLTILVGVAQRGRSSLPRAGLVVALVAAAVGLMPLGTGRTDAYLYVPLLLLVGLGIDRLMRLGSSRVVRGFVVLAVAACAFVGLLDRTLHVHPYPGGNFRAAVAEVQGTLDRGGALIVEGTARWPWVYYEESTVQLVFSDRYNTGFAPVVHRPHVVVMRASQIEGGYDPAAAVNALYGVSEIVTLRADDWDTANPLGPSLVGACYIHDRHQHVPGYFIDVWRHRCLPD